MRLTNTANLDTAGLKITLPNGGPGFTTGSFDGRAKGRPKIRNANATVGVGTEMSPFANVDKTLNAPGIGSGRAKEGIIK